MKPASFLYGALCALIICVFAVLSSCNSGTTKAIGFSADLDEVFDIRYGTTVNLPSEHLSIMFKKVREGRCPRSVQCVQAGEGVATFEVMVDNQREDLVLSAKGLCESDGSCGEAKVILNYTIELINLFPYPGEVLEDAINYSAKMRVTRQPVGETR